MSFVTKYRCEFYDLAGLDWKFEFQWDGYTTPVYDMLAAGSPAIYEPLASTDDLYDAPVRGTKAELRVMATSSFQYIAFFTITDLQVKALIYQGGILYFEGYVLPKSYSEPYNDTPYEIVISMVDGLAALKNIKYDNAGTKYTGRKLESQILLDILAKIGITTFSEIVNIYETNMADAVTDSPLDQVKIEVSLFDNMYCYEVLEKLLTKWNALIRQYDSMFYIYRPEEMITTAYIRTFTAATTKTDSSVNYIQPINRIATASELRDVNGGKKILIPSLKKLNINFDYGNKESWIKNWELKGETFDGTDFENWIRGGGATISTPSSVLAGEKDGIYIDEYDTTPPYAYYVEQTFAPDAMDSYVPGNSELIGLEIDFLFFNSSVAPIATPYFFIEITQGTYHAVLGADEYFAWVPGAVTPILITKNAPVGSSGWSTWKKTCPFGTSDLGAITIKIFAANDADIRVAFKNIKFYAYSVEISKIPEKTIIIHTGTFVRVGQKFYEDTYSKTIPGTGITNFRKILRKEYIITNAINGEEQEMNHVMGDVVEADVDIKNIIEQFAGSLATSLLDTLVQTASDFVDDHGGEFTGITVDHSGNDIIFMENDGNDFTGATSITNLTDSLSGTVVNTQAHSAGQKKIDTITLSGLAGTANISVTLKAPVSVFTRLATFNTDWEQTAIDFVTSWVTDYDAEGIILTSSGDDIILTQKTLAAGDEWSDTTITNVTPHLTGTVVNTQPFIPVSVRIDTITLTGYDGTANITVDAVTKEVDVDELLSPSAVWNTRGGTEADPLLEITGGQIGHQFSRPRQMIAGLPVYDRYAGDINPHVNILGSFVDDLNIDQADFDIRAIATWVCTDCTLVITGGYARYTATSANSNIWQDDTGLKGSVSKVISIRYKVISGPATNGKIRYTTVGHGLTESYKKEFNLDEDGEWHTLLLDMSSLTAGGTDWIDSIITSVEFMLTDEDGAIIDIDWIGFRRFFVFNRGIFDIKNRHWDMDLIEIVR